MKRILLLFMVVAIVFSFSCSKKGSEETTGSQQVSSTEEAKSIYMFDPVSGNMIKPEEAKYHYVYRDVKYYFETKKNYEKFRKDPERYLKK